MPSISLRVKDKDASYDYKYNESASALNATDPPLCLIRIL
jgi:hypothetical protein